MLGEFVTRLLVLVLGYGYPAFECFKIVEKNRVEIEELRYWCQYWILVAVITVLERICDIFISWVPMYWEIKLAFFIYLWYPKTKGSGYVYDTLLKPCMIKHETDIERNLQVFKDRAWDLLIYYWENCTQLSQSTFFEAIEYLASRVGKLRHSTLQANESRNIPSAPPSTPPAVPPSPGPNTPSSATGIFRRHRQSMEKRRPPLPPQSPFSARHSVAQLSPSESFQVRLHEQTQFVVTEDPSLETETESESDYYSKTPKSKSNSNPEDKQQNLNQHPALARLKLRRLKGIN